MKHYDVQTKGPYGWVTTTSMPLLWSATHVANICVNQKFKVRIVKWVGEVKWQSK